ncbi:MAG: cupredoxin domain-containing protein [Chloroflexi bacterium]|nr:cupredoxin domain-containing protein [Chloroflexota bacterium]
MVSIPILKRAASGVVALALVASACVQAAPASSAPVNAPAPQTSAASVRSPGAVPIAFIAADKRTPDQWMEYLGVRLVEARDSSGPAAYTPKPGDLYFVTNESTTWGATNQRNNIVVIDAKTKKIVAVSQLPDEYALGYGSHSAGVSSDGRWVYIPAQGLKNYLLVVDARSLKIAKVYETLGRPHHVNNFTAPDGRELILITDFGWNWTGSGVWVVDPAQDNVIVGGMSRADFSGHPYVVSGEAGPYVYATVPAPTAALREKVEGYLAKIDTRTWKVVAMAPVGDPIWPEVAADGKTAWVTLGGHSKVAKVDLTTMKVIEEVTTGPGPWGARLSYDETKLYVADKGEAGGYGQQGRTMTIVDTQTNTVSNVVPIGVTTDHIILSPDGKELWATSNAEHAIYVIDADKEERTAIIKMPNDGDTHGSTFVRYYDDGKGGVAGEVVASFTGLRGSARKAQLAYLRGEQPTLVKVSPPNAFFGLPSRFTPDTVTVKPGSAIRLTFVNAGGTSGGTIAVESQAMGFAKVDLKAQQRTTVTWTAPAKASTFEVKNPRDPKGLPLKVVVGETSAARPVENKEIALVGNKNQFEPNAIKLKAGERVRIALSNKDDEPHNLVGKDVNIVSSLVKPGGTEKLNLTAPTKPGTYTLVCTIHPSMEIKVTVEQ